MKPLAVFSLLLLLLSVACGPEPHVEATVIAETFEITPE